MKPGLLLVSFFVVWLLVGLAWLLPKKLALLRQLGNLSNDELVQKAKGGNIEAKELRRQTWWFVGVGLAVLLPLSFMHNILKLTQ